VEDGTPTRYRSFHPALKTYKMNKYLSILYLLAGLLIAFSSTKAKAEDAVVDEGDDLNATITNVTLVWDRNPEPDIAGYNVYYGRISGDYTRLVPVADPTAIIAVKGSKTVYFAVTAYNTNGMESGFSEEVHWP
jgi:purine-cytosine permease-like protein